MLDELPFIAHLREERNVYAYASPGKGRRHSDEFFKSYHKYPRHEFGRVCARLGSNNSALVKMTASCSSMDGTQKLADLLVRAEPSI
ncbi:MAG: hypothetical protein A4E19_04800 [Nitrospira sp. SG-bin1]|nr:MAG: hypothetical protein A4E19_04800 [Nitrospira sp. SG-bin1]